MLYALVRKELIVLSRDLHGLAALFVLPIIFIVLMSMALKDVYSPHANHLQWSYIDEDKSTLSRNFLAAWEKQYGKPTSLATDWEQTVQQGTLKYIFRLEVGLEKDLKAAEKPGRQRIQLVTDPGLDAGVFAALSANMQAMIFALRVENLLQPFAEQGFIDAKTDIVESLSGELIGKSERLSTGPRPTSVQHNVPAWLVFGMFFVVTTIAGLFVEERNSGTLKRMFSLGVNPLVLLFAKVLPFLLINSVQAGLMLAVGVYIMPLLGGDALSLSGVNYLALLVILLSISFAAISIALLVATLVKSQAQASTIGPMMNILMAAIGGIMVPTFVMPPIMQTLASFSPMNWALEGLLNVLLRNGDITSVYTESMLLVLLGSVCISLAFFTFRFRKLT
jgi:ABC-2 type transport system permease protein